MIFILWSHYHSSFMRTIHTHIQCVLIAISQCCWRDYAFLWERYVMCMKGSVPIARRSLSVPPPLSWLLHQLCAWWPPGGDRNRRQGVHINPLMSFKLDIVTMQTCDTVTMYPAQWLIMMSQIEMAYFDGLVHSGHKIFICDQLFSLWCNNRQRIGCG